MPQPKKYSDNATRQAQYRKRLQEKRQEECRHPEGARGLPPLAGIPPLPSHRRWNQLLAMVSALLSMLASEMDDYAGARSEAWQQSERGEAFAERLETITQVGEQLDTLL